MTPLTIIPNYEKKRLKCYGTVAAGEHVLVTVTGGTEWVAPDGENQTLRLRLLFGPYTVGVFPFVTEDMHEKDPETFPNVDEWDVSGDDPTCDLNLNTIQAAKYLKSGGNCLFVLDDPTNDILYATDEFEVLPWPKRMGADLPYDLDGYPDFVKYAQDAIEETRKEIEDAVDEANGIVPHVDEARASASRSAASAANDAASAAANAGIASRSAASAEENASLATRAAIAKMRERTGSRLWHNVALSQNASGQWVMDVDQEPGDDDGAFDADVKALGTTTKRSLAARFAESVNVKDFGAAGDGATDDSAAVSAAVAAARSADAYLHFPKGTYRIAGAVENLLGVAGLVGDGKIKVGNVTLPIHGDGTVTIYAAPDGTGAADGLTPETACDLQTALDAPSKFPMFSGTFKVQLAEGVYEDGYRIANVRLSKRMQVLGAARENGACTTVIDGIGGEGSVAVEKLFGLRIDNSFVLARDIEFRNWRGGIGVGTGDASRGVWCNDNSNLWCDDCDFDNCGVGCYATHSQIYQGGGTVTNCDDGTIVFGSAICSLGYNGKGTEYVGWSRTENDTTTRYGRGITVRDSSSGVIENCVFNECTIGVRMIHGSIARVSTCRFTTSDVTDVALYTGSSCYFGADNTYTEGKSLRCYGAIDLEHSNQLFYNGDTDRFNFGALASPGYKFQFSAKANVRAAVPGATGLVLNDDNPAFGLNASQISTLAGLRIAIPNKSGEAAALYDISTKRWRFICNNGTTTAWIGEDGILPASNNSQKLGASTLRWSTVWTAGGDVEARLAALETAVAALNSGSTSVSG